MSGVSVPSPHEASRRSFSFRASRVRWPEWVVLVSAIVLLVSLLALNWFTVSPPGRSVDGVSGLLPSPVSENGWTGLSHARWLILITLASAFILFIAQATRRSPAWPATFSVLTLILAALSTLWLIIRVPIDPPGGRDFGGWLALVSCAVLTWGAYWSVRMEGVALADGPGEIRVVSAEELAGQPAGPSGAPEPVLGEHS
jgi:hypothetical protein